MRECFKRVFGVRLRTEWLLKVLPPSARTTSTSSRNNSIDLHVLPEELDEKLATLHFPALGEVLAVPRWKRVTSARRATTQGPIRWKRGLTQNSRAGNPKRCDLNCHSRADCFINATPLRRPVAVGWAPLVCAGPLTTSLRGLWVSGYCPVQWWTVQKGGDPGTDHAKKGTTRTPGWQPKENAT